MHMAQRKFRTKQAVSAFERCAECSTLPAEKRGEVQRAIQGGKARLADQDANVSRVDNSPVSGSKCNLVFAAGVHQFIRAQSFMQIRFHLFSRFS